MKVVIATSQNAINYGAVLQAYALYRFIKNMGITPCLLNVKRKSKLYFSPLDFSSVKNIISGILNNAIGLWYINAIHTKKKRFESFVKNNIKTTQEYKLVSELLKNPPKADIYITGGDQMFNTCSGVSDVGFLGFGDENIKRVSYSTSMGISEPPREYLNQFVNMINRYYMVSLREKSAKNFIDKHCKVKTTNNIDPVFLLNKNEWLEIISEQERIRSKPYILVYQLLYHPLTVQILEKLRAKTGHDVVIISPSARNRIKGNQVIRNAGPIEFISLFSNAEAIITTSFHGTCFSILFEKDFYSLVNTKREVRINELLELFGLTHRMVTESADIDFKEIDYTYPRLIIENERKRSKEYLSKILGEN